MANRQIYLKGEQDRHVNQMVEIGKYKNDSQYIQALVDRDMRGDPEYIERELLRAREDVGMWERMKEIAGERAIETRTEAEEKTSLREQIITDLKEGVGSRTNKHDILGYFTAPKFVEQFDAMHMTPGAFVREYYPDAV